MASDVVRPLDDAEADALLAQLAPYYSLIVAVSGGADSTALMHFVAGWCRRRGTADCQMLAITIDHGLRPEGAGEAAEVARQAAGLGIEHRTLRWSGPKPTTGIQAAARTARYDFLHAIAVEAGHSSPTAILTAHTADDQAETLLMRLARGSGVDGLASIPAVGCLQRPDRWGQILSYPLIRPLLAVPHARLVATLRVAGIPFADDPSNRDSRFERVRVREALSLLEGLGFDRIALARTADRMQAARVALELATDRLAERAVEPVLGLVYEIDKDMLGEAPEETGIRLLRRMLALAGGAGRPAELSTIENAYRQLSQAKAGRMALTLGGCIVETFRREAGQREAGDRTWLRIYREPARDGGPPPILLNSGEHGLWDRRVWASVSPEYPGSLSFGAIGADWPALVSQHTCLASLPMPVAAASGIPAFRDAGVIVAVPSLASYASSRGDEAAGLALGGPRSASASSQRRPLLRAWTVQPSAMQEPSDP